jgi:ribose/xylose/arabinose/galactoside ABC-type transport system permease subunit
MDRGIHDGVRGIERSMSSEPSMSSPRVSRTLRAWRWFVRAELGPLLALIALLVLFTAADRVWGGGRFASVRNFRVVLNQTSIVAVASLGMTLIIIAGGIDLSAGTALTLCATVLAYGLKNDVGPNVAIAATILVGCLSGFVNGALISALRVVPFIVTLGTMTVYLGIGKIVCRETTIFPSREQIPGWLQSLCSTRPPDLIAGWLPNVPPGVLLALLLGVLVALALRYTVLGRHVFALGSSESTARLCGVNVPFTKTLVYTLAGFFVAVGGIYHFANLKIGNPMEGVGLELQVIAAVVIGGGSLSGGRGSVLGSFTGAAIMAVIRSGCDQLEVPNPYQEIIIGVIIIAAVAVDQLRQRRE